MKRSFLIAIPLLTVSVLAGCATNPKKDAQATERSLSTKTGTEIRWIQQEKDQQEIEKLVAPLLQQELTPDSAVRIAILNNRTLQADFEKVGISRAELIQAGLLKNPEFAASWQFSNTPGTQTKTEYSLAGDILELFILPLRKKIAAHNLEQTELNVADEIFKLASEVKTVFYTLQAHEQLLARLKLIVEVNEAAADLARRQFEAGNISTLDLNNQQAIAAASRIQVAMATKSIRQDREKLNRLLGLWGSNLNWKVAAELPEIPKQEMSLTNLESIAVSQRLDLAASKDRVDTAGYALALRTKTRYLPTAIHLGVDSEHEPEGERVTGPTLSLELPIFDRGQGDIARLQSEYRQAQRELEALAVNVRSEVREAADMVILNRDLAQYYRTTLVPQRQQISRETLLQYNAMQKGTYELLSAREHQLETEREYIEAWRDYWIARAELERALGGNLSLKSQPASTTAPSQTSPVDKAHTNHHNH